MRERNEEREREGECVRLNVKREREREREGECVKLNVKRERESQKCLKQTLKETQVKERNK